MANWKDIMRSRGVDPDAKEKSRVEKQASEKSYVDQVAQKERQLGLTQIDAPKTNVTISAAERALLDAPKAVSTAAPYTGQALKAIQPERTSQALANAVQDAKEASEQKSASVRLVSPQADVVKRSVVPAALESWGAESLGTVKTLQGLIQPKENRSAFEQAMDLAEATAKTPESVLYADTERTIKMSDGSEVPIRIPVRETTLKEQGADEFNRATEIRNLALEGKGLGSQILFDVTKTVPDLVLTSLLAVASGGTGTAAKEGAKMTAKTMAQTIAKKAAVSPETLPLAAKIFAGDYQSVLSQTGDEGRAIAAGLASAWIQSIIEKGGIQDFFKQGGKGLAQFGRAALSEGLEEVIQDPVSPLIQSTVGGVQDIPVFSMGGEGIIDPQRAAYSGLVGAIAGGIGGSPALAVNGVRTNVQNQTILQAQPVIQTGMDAIADAPAVADSVLELGISSQVQPNIQEAPAPYEQVLDAEINKAQTELADLEYQRNYLGEIVDTSQVEQRIAALEAEKTSLAVGKESRIEQASDTYAYENTPADINSLISELRGTPVEANQGVPQNVAENFPERIASNVEQIRNISPVSSETNRTVITPVEQASISQTDQVQPGREVAAIAFAPESDISGSEASIYLGSTWSSPKGIESTVSQINGNRVALETPNGTVRMTADRLMQNYIPIVETAASDSVSLDQPVQETRRVTNQRSVQGYSAAANLQSDILPEGNRTQTSAKTMDDLISILEKESGVPIRTGKFNQKALGIFKVKPEVIRTKVRNRLPVITHEYGHYLDKVNKFSTSSSFDNELLALGRETSRPTYTKEMIREEGIAEFIRLYLTDVDSAVEKAPSFMKKFEESIGDETLSFLTQFRDDVTQYKNLDTTSRIISSVSDHETRTSNMPQVNIVNKIYDAWVNSGGAFERAQKFAVQKGWKGKNLKLAADVYQGLEAKVMSMFSDAQRSLDGSVVGKSFNDILAPISAKGIKGKGWGSPIKVRKDFIAYAISRRAMDYKGRNFPMPDPWTVYESKIIESEAQYGDTFKDVFNDLRKWEDNSLQWLVDSGLKTEKYVDAIKLLNANHMPLQRIQEAMEARRPGGGASMGQSRNVIKKAHGSGATIIDPIESIIANAFIIRRAAEANQVIGILHDMAQQVDGIGGMVEIVPGSFKGFDFAVDEIKGQLRKIAEANENTVLLDAISNMTDAELESAISVFRPLVQEKNNEVMYYQDGKAVKMQVDPEIYKAIKGLNNQASNFLIRLLNKPKKIQQAGVVTTPEFVLRNIIRDTFTASIQSEAGVNMSDIIRGYVSAARKDKWFKQWIASGGGTEYIMTSERAALQKIEDSAFGFGSAQKSQMFLQAFSDFNSNRNMRTFSKMLLAARQMTDIPMEIIRDAAAFSEAGPRIAEFKKAAESGNFTTEEAAAMSRRITQDFKRSGYYGKELNKVTGFFNANIQGTMRFLETMKKQPVKTMARGFLYLTLPTMALYAVNYDDKDYEQLPDWRKFMFWNVPIGDGKYLSIPKPYGYGYLFGSIPEMLLDKALKDDPKTGDRMIEMFKQNFGFPLMPTAFGPAIEVAANKSWNDVPIESQYDRESKPAWMISSNSTSEIAKTIGDILKNETGLSPKQIDYLVKGYTGTLGDAIWRLPDAVKSGENPASAGGLPVVSKFVVDAVFSNASTSNLYSNAEELTKRWNEEKQLNEYTAAQHLPESLRDKVTGETDQYRLEANRLLSDISDAKKVYRNIESGDLPKNEKKEKLREIQDAINQSANEFNKKYEAFKKKYRIK